VSCVSHNAVPPELQEVNASIVGAASCCSPAVEPRRGEPRPPSSVVEVLENQHRASSNRITVLQACRRRCRLRRRAPQVKLQRSHAGYEGDGMPKEMTGGFFLFLQSSVVIGSIMWWQKASCPSSSNPRDKGFFDVIKQMCNCNDLRYLLA
jgi:hypothetical protein